MTERPDRTATEDPDSDARDDDARQLMVDVDHTHPDTDEPFTETGVYDRGKKQSDEADEAEDG